MESNPEITPELLLSHAPSLRALARRLVREATAEDVVQETWLAALERPPRRADGLGAWLRTVLRNRVRLQARGEARRERRDQAAARPEAIESTGELVERRAALGRLVTALEELPEPYGDTVWMRFFDELSTPEIARRLGIAETTVRTRLHRGLALLKRRLEREPGGERGAWVPALAAASGLGRREAGLGRGAVGMGALIMSTNIKVAVVAIGLIILFFFLWRGAESPAGATTPDAFEPGMEEVATIRVPVELGRSEEATDPSERAVVETPAPPEPAVEESVEPEPLPVVVSGEEALLRLRRRFVSTTELKVYSASVQVDGQKRSLGNWAPKKTPDIGHEVVVLDEVMALGFGRPQRLRRTYEKLSATRSRRGQKVIDLCGENPLVSLPLRLEYDPTTEAWGAPYSVATPSGDRVDARWFEGLTGDLDLRELAPPAGLRPGEHYSVPPEKLATLFRPGGEIFKNTSYWGQEAAGPNPFGFFAASSAVFGDHPASGAKVEGGLELVLRPDSGADPAPPRLTFKLELKLKGQWLDLFDGEESTSRKPPDQVCFVDWAAQGEMTWNVLENRVEALRLEGDLKAHSAVSFKGTAAEPEVEKFISLMGTSTLVVEVQELSEWPESDEASLRKR